MGANSNIDYGAALGAFYQGYKDKQELAQKQQQLDYEYPKELVLPTEFPNLLSSNPEQTLRNTYNTAINSRPPPTLYQGSQFNEATGQYQTPPPPRKTLGQQPGQQDQIVTQDFNPNTPKVNGINRSPGGVSVEDLPPEKQQALQQNYAARQQLAQQLGIRVDPVTGEQRATGAQAHFYMEWLKPLLAHEASIWASVGRPPQPIVIPPNTINNRPTGSGKEKAPDPMKDAAAFIKANKVDALAALTDPGAKQKAAEAQAIYNMWVQRGVKPVLELQAFNDKYTPIYLNKGQGAVNSAPPPGKSQLTEQQIRQDRNFAPLVKSYMDKHKVSKEQAEQAIIIFKQSR